MENKKVTVAAVQMPTTEDKELNHKTMVEYVEKAVRENPGIDILCLPEMWNCVFRNSLFPVFAEEQGGPSYQLLADLAKKHRIWLVGGTVPERDGENIHNTCYIFNRQGELVTKHRKMHMFDIDVKGGQRSMESAIITPGNQITTFETEFGTIGVAVCYDIRFPEYFRLLADRGAKIVFVPGAFNMTTGPAHWELTFRARALDNQAYYIGCEPAHDPNGRYVPWGHSIITNPWGQVEGQLDFEAGILVRELDLSYVDGIRQQLPLLQHRRLDLYETKEK